MLVRPLSIADLPALRTLATSAEAEGFRFLARLVEELEGGHVQLDTPCEYFLAVVVEDSLAAIGGVTPDPYVDDPTVGRLRHLYVSPMFRRAGIGRALVARLEARAISCYSHLRLRTDTLSAAQFYESLGYQPAQSDSATHMRVLSGRFTRDQPNER